MGGAVTGDVLTLDIPATTSFLSVLRTATAGLATRLGYGLDGIEDLRVAVDEAAGMLLSAAGDRSGEVVLNCRFDVTATQLLITIGARGVGPLPRQASFTWRVLDALAGEVATTTDGETTSVTLIQERPVAAGGPQARLRPGSRRVQLHESGP